MEERKLAFGRKNYVIMLIGVGLIALGLFVMTLDEEPYGFGTLGLTVGPLIMFVGFLTEFVAIMWRDRS